MFLNRIDNRKKQEQAYRKQLQEEVLLKSRISAHNSLEYHPQSQAFSLITNIQKEQQQRKKKNTDYYEELKLQIEEERKLKQKFSEEKKRKELEEENKLRQEQQRLRSRYEEEIKKEKGKGRGEPEILSSNPNQDFVKKNPKGNPKQYLKSPTEHQFEDIREAEALATPVKFAPLEQVNLKPIAFRAYPNKIQNETFNYVPRISFKSSYYRELLGQRKQLDDQTHSIAEMNHLFQFQQSRPKEESRGILELRNLHQMLDEKNVDFLGLEKTATRTKESGIQLMSGSKMGGGSNYSTRLNRDEWKKLD